MIVVTVRPARAKHDAEIVIATPDGTPVVLSAYEARELQRRILSAAIEVERGERARTARTKTTDERRLKRAAGVDAQLIARDEEV